MSVIGEVVNDPRKARLWTTAGLRGVGFHKGKVAALVKAGKLFRLFRGLYSNCPMSPLMLALALVKTRKSIVFEGKTAMEIYMGRPLTFPLHARVPDRSFRTGLQDKLVLRRTRNTHHVVIDGLPVVSVVDLLTNMLKWAHSSGLDAAGRPVAKQVFEERYADLLQPADPSTFSNRPASLVPPRLIELFEQHYKGRSGLQRLEADLGHLSSQKLRIAIPFLRDVVVAGAESSLEIKCVLSMRKEGFYPSTQVSAGEYRWDMGLDELGLLIDVDGERYHLDNTEAFYMDRWKTTDAQLEGWMAMRICGACFDSHFDQVITRLKHIRATSKPKAKMREKRKAAHPKTPIEPAWKWHYQISRFTPAL